eukprot:COSAG02_NODE_861_length_16429_cov_75.930680_12_plen_74_part_00
MDDSSGVPTKTIIKKYDEIMGNFFVRMPHIASASFWSAATTTVVRTLTSDAFVLQIGNYYGQEGVSFAVSAYS